jgi:hypothetical protein
MSQEQKIIRAKVGYWNWQAARFQALEPIHQGVRQHFGGFGGANFPDHRGAAEIRPGTA